MLQQPAESDSRTEREQGDLISYFIDFQKLDSNQTKRKINCIECIDGLCNDALTY